MKVTRLPLLLLASSLAAAQPVDESTPDPPATTEQAEPEAAAADDAAAPPDAATAPGTADASSVPEDQADAPAVDGEAAAEAEDAAAPADGESGASEANKDSKKKKEEKPKEEKPDDYLINWQKYEHRDERTPGRGPMGRKIGLGMALGRPLSAGVKVYFTQTVAFQADVGVGYSWAGPEMSAQAHVVWHPYTLLANERMKISTYVGAGGRGAFWPLLVVGIPEFVPACQRPIPADTVLAAVQGNPSELTTLRGCYRPAFLYVPGAENFPGTLGPQVMAGLDLQLNNVPMEMYVQPIATLEVFPGISADLGLQMGLRWYFY